MLCKITASYFDKTYTLWATSSIM